MKYTLELTKQQVRHLSMAAEFTSRFICGQMGTSSWPHEALHGMAQKHWPAEEWCDARDRIDELLDQIKAIGWGMNPNAHYGVGYNETSDTLWDIYQVIRHQLWQDREGEKSTMTVDSNPAMRFGPEPLATIKKEQP